MPRDTGTGIYSTPAGTDGIPNRTISSTAYNLNVHDVETDLNTPRPIIAGGTGAADAAAALQNARRHAQARHRAMLSAAGRAKHDRPTDAAAGERQSALDQGKLGDYTRCWRDAGAHWQYRQYVLLHLRLHECRRDDAGIFHGQPMPCRPAPACKIKTGDPTRTLVGMAAAWPSNSTWSANFTDVARCSIRRTRLIPFRSRQHHNHEHDAHADRGGLTTFAS